MEYRNLLFLISLVLLFSPILSVNPFINEFHYDNFQGDRGERVEIAVPPSSSINAFSLALYNGRNGEVYSTVQLSGSNTSPTEWEFFVFDTPGLQNGSPDGIALVNRVGIVLEFISYEGTFTATSGPAEGTNSVDVGVSESGGTPEGHSLQLDGMGCVSSDFTWRSPASNSFGIINPGQSFRSIDECEDGSGNGPVVEEVKIGVVQGQGTRSEFVREVVSVRGIVTAVDREGFYMQDKEGDGTDATSDAVYVVTGTSGSAIIGEEVLVTGIVVEDTPGGDNSMNQPTTQILLSSITSLSGGNSLPAPIEIGVNGRAPPTASIPNGIAFFESLESMRVIVKDALVIAPTNRDREIYVVPNQGAGATGISSRGTLTISDGDFNPEKIQVDVNSNVFSFSVPNAQVGDTIPEVVGVISYRSGQYEIIPTEPFSVVPGTLQPAVTSVLKTPENIAVASYNVKNFVQRSEPEGPRFALLARQITVNLQSPDIIGLQEIQDNNGAEGDSSVVSADETLQELVNAIALAGGPMYSFQDNTFIRANLNGGQPTGNIRVVYLYNPDRVILESANSIRASDQSSSSNPFFRSRLPLVGNFRSVASGATLQITNVHFSSKGGSAPLFGTVQPFEDLQNDPDVNSGVDSRLDQASAVRQFLLSNEGQASNQIVLGDMNEFDFVGPVEELSLGRENLISSLSEEERYTFIFQGNAQALDHMIVDQGLAQNVERFEIVHCNVEFDEERERSDHEPIIASFNI